MMMMTIGQTVWGDDKNYTNSFAPLMHCSPVFEPPAPPALIVPCPISFASDFDNLNNPLNRTCWSPALKIHPKTHMDCR